jgi:hypothetical protein
MARQRPASLNDHSQTNIHRHHVATANPRRDPRKGDGWLCCSTHCFSGWKVLGYWHNDGQPGTSWRVGIYSTETGKQVPTFDVAPTVQIGWDKLLRWSADSQSLTYVDYRGGMENVWAQPIDGGPAKQLSNFTESKIFSFDWSRDGSLVVSKGVITSDVVLITDAGQ